MYIMYDFSVIKEEADNVLVEARYFTGDYEDVTEDTGDGNTYTERRFIRKEGLYDVRKFFPKGSTKDDWRAFFNAHMDLHTNLTNLW